MNMALRLGSAIILFFSVITSCKKSSNDSPRDPNKLRISKITQTAVSAPRTKSATNFIYDEQRRVKRITTTSDTSATVPMSNLTYYYHDTDKNPYRASGQVLSGWVADIFYTYNNAGILIRDSAINAGATEVRTHDYTYSPDKIIVKKGYYFTSNPGGVAGNTLIDSVVIKNNNIAEIVYPTGSIGQSAYYFQLSYDDKINPLNKLNIAAVKVTEGLNGFPDIMAPGFCKNNITAYTTGTISYSGVRSEKATQPYVFTYTKEGLPESCTVTTQLDTYIFNYFYEEF